MSNKSRDKNSIFDLHLDLEVYFNRDFTKLINMSVKRLNTFYDRRHFDLVQANKVGLKYLVVQIQSLKYDAYHKKIKPLKDIKNFLFNFESFIAKIKNYSNLKIIRNVDDFKSLRQKQIGIFLGVEGLNFVNRFEDIEILWKLGFRVFGLTWNFDNEVAGGLAGKNSLTKLGKKIVNFIAKNGGIIDCAHLNLISAKEVIKLAPQNFIFSHNNLSEIYNFRQNLSKEILNLIKNKKTLIGLSLLPLALCDLNLRKPSFSDWFLNYRKLMEFNSNLVAIGTDYFGFNYKESPQGAENYIKFNSNLEKFKVKKDKIFKNSLNFFYDKIKLWS